MSRRVRVPRSVEEKWEIVEEGLRSGNIAETCRRYGIAPNLFYRRKDEAQQGVMAALGGGRALPRRRTSRGGASGNWSGRWDGRRWRWRS